jgi:membrane-associated phospholipid phosphatase
VFRSQSLALALAFTLPAAPLAGQDLAYRATWWDAVSVGAGGILTVIPILAKIPSGPPPCAPCNPNDLSRFDRLAVHHYDAAADQGSSILLLGMSGAAALGSVWGQRRDAALGNAAAFADAVTWATAADEWLKVLIHRNRPILYTSDAPFAAQSRGNQESFPSGHAELAFAVATAYTTIARREHLPHATRNAVVLYVAASAVSVLRVAAAKHFPTDVLAGAVLGSAVSWVVVKVHR